MSRSPNKPNDSETTGPRKVGAVARNAIGQPHGATGYTALLSSTERQQALAALAQRTPQENDRALTASLKQHCGLPHEARTVSHFPADRRWYQVVERIDIPESANPDWLLAAIEVEKAALPLPHADTVRKLAELRLLTRSRPQDDDDMALQFAAYADRLADYPADCTHQAIDQWTETPSGHFWPTWKELRDIVAALASYRVAMRNLVRLKMRMPA